ncbi:MAG: alpha/beta hydrolase [Anaerolineae bacterium]|nr:alpha/beta hydrolase [Anaerolineae bacterium]
MVLPVSIGLTSRYIITPQLRLHLLERGSGHHRVLFVHGNISAATWWEELMLALPEADFHSVALDLRGYGHSQATPVDATRGVLDFCEDILALAVALGWEQFHLVGHSLGTGIAMQLLLDHPQRLQSVTLIGAMSPYGFGGTRGAEGIPIWPDYAGTGARMFNPELLRLMQAQYRGTEHPFAPLNALRNVVWHPSFQHPRESIILDSMLMPTLGEDNLPGDWTPSEHWPYFAPGTRGVSNAISPKYFNVSGIADLALKPPIWWVGGDADLVTSNEAASDTGRLGKVGRIPDYPGEAVFPIQPMHGQLAAVLARYGNVQKTFFQNAGHSPHLEQLNRFAPLFISFLSQATATTQAP